MITFLELTVTQEVLGSSPKKILAMMGFLNGAIYAYCQRYELTRQEGEKASEFKLTKWALKKAKALSTIECPLTWLHDTIEKFWGFTTSRRFIAPPKNALHHQWRQCFE
jgi:hypothetical protein